MNAQMVAKVFGWVFIAVGLLGFFTFAGIGGSMGMSTGMLLGLFPVNAVHNVVHLAFGVWGIMAAKTAEGAVNYCKIGGIVYLLLGALGMVNSVASMLAGYVPIHGNDAFLHLVLGVILAYFGFVGSKAPAAA